MKVMIRPLAVAFLAVFLSACATSSPVTTESVSNGIVKSPADSREYRSLILDNGLKVMLVSDPVADRAAAALDVHVGSGNDPKDREGLAHYLEHMLFLGTEKYPESGEYQQYIAEHGGSNNAYTVINHTNFYFSITPEYLEGGLDRFAQFFIAPKFTAKYVTRERAIVDSEYQARKDNEGRRLWTARRVVYNPAHPSTQFSVGSLSTLADRENDPVREDLIAFYKHYYHAPRMALSVIGNQSLDQLQAWVEAKFSAIPDGGDPYRPFAERLLLPGTLPVQLTLKPIKEIRQLSFSFPIDSVYAYTDSKPARYLSTLLGHEGEGSLLALLKAKGWVNGLSAGLGYSDDVQATFDIQMDLSEQGFGHIEEIGEMLFAQFELIRQQGVRPIYFDELKKLAEIDFRFQEKGSESGLVQRLASQLHRYPAKQVLSTPYRYQRYAPDQIQAILARFQPDNLQLIVVDPALESEQKTDWYGVEYRIEPIDSSWIGKWLSPAKVAALALPEPNPFIPDELSLLDSQNGVMAKPERLEGPAGMAVWHQSRVDFKQPKAELYFTLRANAANGSARNVMLTELYVKAVEEALSAYSYPAMLAGLKYQIYRHSRGLSVRISGYSAKQTQLLDKIVQQMQKLDIDESRFALYKQNIRRGIENSLKGTPSDRVIDGVYDVLLTSSWSDQEKLRALMGVHLADLKAHAAALLQAPDLMLLSVGNVAPEDSLTAARVLEALNPDGAAGPVKRAQVRKLPTAQWTLYDTPSIQSDSAIALVYQGGAADIDELAATQLLGSLIRTPYYQTLRTEAQVGYIVSAFAFNILDTPALGFAVQSNSHSVAQVVEKTHEFVRSYADAIAAMPIDSFNRSKAGLIARLTQEDKKLADVASRDWAELDRQAYDFDTRERLVAAIEKIDRPVLQAYFRQLTDDSKAAALLNYSTGKLASDLDVTNGQKVVRLNSVDDARRQFQNYFQTPGG